MSSYNTDNIRNVALVGHAGSGIRIQLQIAVEGGCEGGGEGEEEQGGEEEAAGEGLCELG